MKHNALRLAREAKQLSKVELGKTVGVSQETIGAIEKSTQEPSLQMALRLGEALNVPVEQLFPKRLDNYSQVDLSTQLKQYQELLDFIFGCGTCSIEVNQSGVNNLVGAITSERDMTFDSFRVNFIERLNRLISIYGTDASFMKTIARLATEVGSDNGGGAYAELGAIDYLARMYKHIISKPPALDVNIPASRTFASTIPNRQIANLDGYIEELDTYFDVKSLQDITDSILRKPIRELSKKYGAHILPERDFPYDYTQLQSSINSVRTELETALASKQTYLKVHAVKGLTFRMSWSPGVLSAVGTHDPYKDALIRHKGIFDYGDKFVRDSPFVLVLTAVPWTHNLSSFMDSDDTFFRALSRRVFCQYIDSPEVHPKFGVTFEELSKSISLIVFLQLHDTLGEEKEAIEATVFANPNANHRYPGRIRDFLNEQRVAIQEFETDNY